MEERMQVREVIGSVKKMTKSEAQRRIKEFMVNVDVNTASAKIPCVLTFAQTVKTYREKFAPRMLRASTYSMADCHLKKHLEPDWNDTPIEHITIDAVNEWIWKKRQTGLSWVTIKNILRTMQRVLSCSSKDKKPPFSQQGLAIPEKDKLQMQIRSRQVVSFSWADAKRIATAVRKLDSLDESRKNNYAMAFLLASATGLRCGELFALRVNDVDFKTRTIRVDESADQRTYTVGPCKNAAAYRVVLLVDREGKEAMRLLKKFLSGNRAENSFVFHSRNSSPLRETNVLVDGLHPALSAIGLPKAGMHAFRHGCNRRWELSGVNPAVIRQFMGHSSAAMTARYTGEIPLEAIRTASKMRVVTQCDPRQLEAVA
ncbi:MAG TPA: site-specific integrase [Candidatus Aquilonibacter sp.]|nr:site-specific integrase [Candidatus Aquilonibacter sp.]